MAIDELEKEGEVLCTRTVKDGQLRMVFWNEVKPKEMGEGILVEQEFLDLWHELKVPNDVDLLKQLENGALFVLFLSIYDTHHQRVYKQQMRNKQRPRLPQ